MRYDFDKLAHYAIFICFYSHLFNCMILFIIWFSVHFFYYLRTKCFNLRYELSYVHRYTFRHKHRYNLIRICWWTEEKLWFNWGRHKIEIKYLSQAQHNIQYNSNSSTCILNIYMNWIPTITFPRRFLCNFRWCKTRRHVTSISQ